HHPPPPAARGHPVPVRPRLPADQDQRRLVLTRADRPAARLRPARGRIGRRARAARPDRDPAGREGAGHAVPAGRGRARPAGQGRARNLIGAGARTGTGTRRPGPYAGGMDGITMQPHLAGHAGVCEIILDRPEVLNAINTAMATRLAQACAELAANPQTRAVVLSAAGTRAFCVGADLKERNSLNHAGRMAQRGVFRAAFGGLLGLPQPVIAAVHGYALGGGCELALSCDLIVADETAVFGLPETTVGLVPGGGGTQL